MPECDSGMVSGMVSGVAHLETGLIARGSLMLVQPAQPVLESADGSGLLLLHAGPCGQGRC